MIQNNSADPDYDEVSIKEIIIKIKKFTTYLFSRWAVILIAGLAGGSAGFIYATLKKPVYTAECTFVLEESDKGGLSQYAGIASAVGIDLGGSAGGDNGIFQGDNIVELYKSRTMLRNTLLSPADFEGKKQLLVDRYIQFNKLDEAWKKDPRLMNVKFSDYTPGFSYVRDSLLFLIINDIKDKYLMVGKPDKKLSIISVKVSCKDQLFAKEFVNAIVNNVNSFYIGYKTKRSAGNARVLKKQADSIQTALNSSMAGAANAMDATPNANLDRQILRVPSQRKQIEVQKNSAIYTELEKNLFVTNMSQMKETPLIQVIDRPELPLDKEKVGRLKGLLLGGVLAGFLTVFYLGCAVLLKKLMG